MVKFWIEEVEYEVTVRSNLHELDLSKVTLVELVEICIQKWEFVAETIEQNKSLSDELKCGGRDTCALCHRFFINCCSDCPVIQVAGETRCNNTPYDNFRIWGAEPEIIQAEIEFLYRVLEWVGNLATIKE